MTRHGVWGAISPFPPRYTERYMQDDPVDTYHSRSYMFGGPMILMNQITNMPMGPSPPSPSSHVMKMVVVAQSWLVLAMSNSPFLLGLDSFLGDIPILLFSLIGGVVADRVDRRRLLILSYANDACTVNPPSAPPRQQERSPRL